MKCLQSLSENSGRYLKEIIVVDNASTDGSPEAVAESFPDVRLIRNDNNLGFAKANNIGIRESTGKYLCLVNSDVVVKAGCFDVLVDYCETHDGIGMLGPHVVGKDGHLQRSCRGFPSVWNMVCRAFGLDSMFPKTRLFSSYLLTYWAHDEIREVAILSGCFWMVNRIALDQVGLLDENFFMYGEDMDWCKRFRNAGWKNVFVPGAQIMHYGGASSANAPVRFYLEMHKADLQYWKKHHGALAVSCYRAAALLHVVFRAVGWAFAAPFLKIGREENRFKIERSKACLIWMLSGSAPAERSGPGSLTSSVATTEKATST